MRFVAVLMFWAGSVAADGASLFDGLPERADIYVLGEYHDNPEHHLTQAAVIGRVNPASVVFEMLTADQEAVIAGLGRVDPDEIGWDDSGWPDFEIYAPVFGAAVEATGGQYIFGAQVPRDRAREAMTKGLVASFSGDARRFGLQQALSDTELAPRLALQDAAHCGAMPADMLPAMVDIQRLRDAELARTALAALDATGGPVVVITGNGHARKDWGVPAMIALARPDTVVFSLGQTEEDAPLEGGFDSIVSAPAVARPDPCAAFR